MGIFRIIASSLILVMFMYVGHQLVRFTDMTWWAGLSLIVGLGLLFFMVISTFLFFWKEKNLDHSPVRDIMLNVSLTTMAYINFLVTLVILRDVFAFFQYLITRTATDAIYTTEATMVILIAPIILILIGYAVVQVGPRLLKINVKYPDLHKDLEGLRILHITDLHISPSLPAVFVKKLVKKILKLKPDLIVFTGDILDSFAEKHTKEMNYLSELGSSHKVFLVPGNHEYYWDAPSALAAFEKIGFQVLVNQTTELAFGSANLQMAGISDPAAIHFGHKGPDLEAVRAKLKDDHFKVLLSHQPSIADKAQTHGFHLQLSGHTHGGQFFPWNFLIVFFERFSKGLYKVGNMQLYVNQGTGYWGPRLRLGTYCELAEIVLRKG